MLRHSHDTWSPSSVTDDMALEVLGEGKIRKRTGYTVPQVKLELISLRRGITPIAKWLATGREAGEEQSAVACSNLAFGLAMDVSWR